MAVTAERVDAFDDRKRIIRKNEILVENENDTKAMAGIARPPGRVKREQPRGKFFERGLGMIRTGVFGGVGAIAPLTPLVNDRNNQPVSEL
jgi:hypothetical protein